MLTIRGADLTALMNFIPFDGLPYPAMPVEVRALLILAKYAVLGLIPVVIPRVLPDVDNPLERINSHEGTDLQYLKKLAHDAGYVFYVETGPVPGTNTGTEAPRSRSAREPASRRYGFRDQRGLAQLPVQERPQDAAGRDGLQHADEDPDPDSDHQEPSESAARPESPLPTRSRFSRTPASSTLPRRRWAWPRRASRPIVSKGRQLNVLRYGHLLKPGRLVGVPRGRAGIRRTLLHHERQHELKVGDTNRVPRCSQRAGLYGSPRCQHLERKMNHNGHGKRTPASTSASTGPRSSTTSIRCRWAG